MNCVDKYLVTEIWGILLLACLLQTVSPWKKYLRLASQTIVLGNAIRINTMEQEKEPESGSNRRWATDGPHRAQPAPWGALKLHWPLTVVRG